MSTTRVGLEFVDPSLEGLAESLRRVTEFDRLQQVRRVTVNTTLEPDDDLVLVTTGAGTITITLPLAKEAQRKLFHVKKIDAAVGTIAITAASGDLIETAASVSVTAFLNTATVLPDPDGSAWWLV